MDIRALIFGLFTFLGTLSTVRGCTSWSFSQCLYPVSGYKFDAPHVQGINKIAYPPTQYTKDSIDALCKQIPDVFECFAQFMEQCKFEVQATVEGLRNSYYLLCRDGGEFITGNDQCFKENKAELESKSSKCLKEYKEKMVEIKDSYEGKAGDGEICKSSKEYIKCEAELMEEQCGTEASEFIQKYRTYSLNPSLSDINCKVGSSTWFTAEKIGIFVGMILVAIVVVAVFCTICGG